MTKKTDKRKRPLYFNGNFKTEEQCNKVRGYCDKNNITYSSFMADASEEKVNKLISLKKIQDEFSRGEGDFYKIFEPVLKRLAKKP